MSKPDSVKQNIMLAEISPSLLLEGEVPRLIDEWQIAPKLWDAVRYEVDHRNEEGQFILTGSAVPADSFGLMFETMCVRDLRVYADALGGKVYHYRDKTGLECDAVIHLRNGSYGLIEMKLGGEEATENGAATLKALEKKIDTDRMKVPAFLMVLTAVGDYAYRREDGIYVVPVGCLRD